MATLHNQHTPTPNVWSSNYRVRPAYLFDSDSDSGCVSDLDADAISKADASDAGLMREMDLSGRHEAVEYRPNPWSIARINAASRSSFPKPALARTPGPARSPSKPQRKPIVEAFKRQAKQGPRGSQPVIVRKVNNLGDNSIGAPSVDKSCAAKRDSLSAKKPRQGCESANTALPQVRACLQRTEPLDPPSPSPTPRAGLTIDAVGALEKEKSAHISIFSDHSPQPAHAPPPFKSRQIFGTHRAAWSSPVRLVPPQSAPDVGHAVRERPTFHHSSPGPRSHVPVSGHIMRLSSPPLVSAPAFTNTRPTKVSNNLPSPSPPPRFPENMGQRTEPIILRALNEEICVSPPSPPLVPELRQDATDPPHIRTSEPRHKRLASPELTPARKRLRASAARPPDPAPPTTSTSRYCPTAYTFGEDDDPDIKWSTLAKTKRRAVTSKRVEKPSGVRQSECFRLPLLGRTQKTPTRAPEVKRRIITYLPPPMANKKLVDNIDGGPWASTNHLANDVTAKITLPTRDPAKHVQVETEEQEVDDEVEIRVMDSDVTLVNEDDEHVTGINIDDVCAQYPTTRATMKAVRVVF
ncbi:hypothetical protein J3R83DRAFT_10685 [Lanmaoa asiatica]|nr:hypothetical protein J3R83DRAFT_10685 [Lanmaoa asiatica]